MFICPHCYKEVDELVEVFNKPIDCICNPKDWTDQYNIPPVCKSFKPMYDCIDQCENCEHLLECHQICSLCNEPTDRCEEDTIWHNDKPICEGCSSFIYCGGF